MDLTFDGLKLAHVPIIHQLFKADIYSQQSRNIKRPSFSTVVTPEVYALSLPFFLQNFKVVKPYNQVLSRSYSHSLNIGEIHGASPIIQWIGSPSVSSFYGAVKIEKTIYKAWHLFYFIISLNLIYLFSLEKLLLCSLERILTK